MIRHIAILAAAALVGGCIVIDEAGHMAGQNCRALYGVTPPSAEYSRCHAYERRRISAQLSAADAMLLQDLQRAIDRTTPGVVAVPAGSTIVTPDGRMVHVPW
jgi:hypothetical protein